MWKQSSKQNLGIPGFVCLGFVTYNQFDVFIYCEETVPRDSWKLFFPSHGLSFQAIHYLYTFKNTAYLCFSVLRPWETFLSTIYICILLRNAMIKCPNVYDVCCQWLLTDFLCIINTLINKFITHCLNLNTENAVAILGILIVYKWKIFLKGRILFFPYQVSAGIDNFHYSNLKI